MNIPDYLKGVIGVSDKDCVCTEQGRPEDYNTASSGLYLDSKFDMKLTSNGPCGTGTMWDLGMSAIVRATKQFIGAQLRCWSDDHDAVKPRRFMVGEQQGFKAPVTVGKTYAGVRITPVVDMPYGEITFHAIDTAFSTTGEESITVMCWDSVAAVPLWSVGLDTFAGSVNRNTITPEQVVPMVVPYSADNRYYLVYEVGDMKPLNTECFCTCNTKRQLLADWLMIEGVSGDDLADFDSWAVSSSLNYGLFLDFTVSCDAVKDICNEPLSYERDALAYTKAEAIFYMALVILSEDMLKRTQLSGYTNWDVEHIVGMRNLWAKEAQTRMDKLCEKAPESNCFACSGSGFRMVSIEG